MGGLVRIFFKRNVLPEFTISVYVVSVIVRM